MLLDLMLANNLGNTRQYQYPDCTVVCSPPPVCCSCIAVPNAWLLTTANDFANNACNACGPLNNTTVTLTRLPGGCTWVSPPIAMSCGTPGNHVRWVLECQGGTVWALYQIWDTDYFGEAWANIPAANFNCLSSNTFTGALGGGGVGCLTSSNMTVVPA
jgi:hypothetical protein